MIKGAVLRSLFAKKADSTPAQNSVSQPPWKIIVADDDPSVHEVTDMALTTFRFESRPVQLIHVYSGRDAVQAVHDHADAACILLDVVMESEHAGLEAAQAIREDVGNRMIRIVLRTGQPGMAPETEVVSKYDIHDYKEKTEITARKLYTLMYSCLRSYRDLRSLERTRFGLSQIIDSAPSIFQLNSLTRFANGALAQLIALSHGADGIYGRSRIPEGMAAEFDQSDVRVLAATGRFSGNLAQEGPPIPQAVIDRVLSHNTGFHEDWFLELFPTNDKKNRFLYIEGISNIDETDAKLLSLFTRNLSIAFDNIRLKEEIENTQREIVYRLGDAVETRSSSTGFHVKRVAVCSALIGERLGLEQSDIDLLEYASPLHDVGKIGIPDAILNKPDKLTPEEWAFMKTHTTMGWRILKDATQPILKVGAQIALQHHEKWDGSGYPQGLRDTQIDRFARIVSVVDVIDALGSRRPYKEPWPVDAIMEEVRRMRGTAFDPEVADAALSIADRLLDVRQRFPDPEPEPRPARAR